MAKRSIENFYTIVKQEGERGATRGKIPASMCQALDAGDGDVIRWDVQGGVVVGGQTLTKSERREYLAENTRVSTAKRKKKEEPEKKSKKSSKPVVKGKKRRDEDDEDERPVKKLKKTNKRKTRVEYDEPEERPKKKKGKLLKKLKKS